MCVLAIPFLLCNFGDLISGFVLRPLEGLIHEHGTGDIWSLAIGTGAGNRGVWRYMINSFREEDRIYYLQEFFYIFSGIGKTVQVS